MPQINRFPLPPCVPGLPLLGNAVNMARDPQSFFVEQFASFGPIFQVRAVGKQFTVMAGAEANRFLQTRGEEYFSSRVTMAGLDNEFNMRVHVLGDRPHRHLRGILRRGLSRDLLAARWDKFTTQTENRIRGWTAGEAVRVVDQFQRLAADQLSTVLTGAATTEHFDELRWAFELMLNATVVGKWPDAVLRLPLYRRARARILAFAKVALDARTVTSSNDAPDLIDYALGATDECGSPYPIEVRTGMVLQGYFAGINTVAYLYSFMLYALLRNPGVMAQVTSEVDAVFSGNGKSLSFDDLKNMPALHGLVCESLRMYPPAPGSTRTALTDFVFNGFRVEKGTRVLVATAVPHQLPEYYPDPGVFNIERDFAECRRRGVYAPFSLGEHTCLGAGLTELIGMATMALVVHNVRLELPSPDYQLRIKSTPGPNPGKRFKVRVVDSRLAQEVRQPPPLAYR